ncbi:MAG: hypothetical protein MI861_09025, partial [Pirellulales bacterium]|nr:hypothetical protein [Pirellulales bacterium]
RRSQRSGVLPRISIALAVLVGVVLLGYGIARGAGWLDAVVADRPSREGKVPVPKSLVALPAFERVTREDVFDLELGDDSYFWLPKAQVERNPDWITDVSQIVGRVMARDKGAEFVFRERDFLPQGSRTGLAGGVPTGKQGFFLDAEQIPGLRLLKIGDRFDLMASLPEESANPDAEFGLLAGGIKARGGKPIPRNGVRVLVQGGQMVALTRGPSMTTQGALNFPQDDSRTGRIGNQQEQVTIAIDPAEVVPLTQALGDKLMIHCVARSGQQLEEDSSANPLAGMVAVPACARSIKAYTRITAADLAEPLTGELRQYYFQPGAVRPGWLSRVDQLLGRVVGHDIDAGYIFSESDFLPPNAVIREIRAYSKITSDDLANPLAGQYAGRVVSRDVGPGELLTESHLLPADASPGVTGGIPVGRMALSVSTDEVQGLQTLSRGDHFYLVASKTFDPSEQLGGKVQLASHLSSGQVVNTVLSEDAIVVDRQDDNVTLAVWPREVTGITKAITLETPIYSVARSGLSPVSVQSSPTRPQPFVIESDPDPLSEISLVEFYVGGKRTVRAYSK